MKKLINWLDSNLLTTLSCLLLVFIPLYPKLPLFDIIPGYIVRIRLEDFLILFTFLVWLVYLIRKKIDLKNIPLSKPIAIYLLIGFLSMLSAVFLTKTVPLQKYHLLKLVLHYLRRIEYFSLFFILYTSLKTRKQLNIYLGAIMATLFGVIIYGYGQKYLSWPAFSTMNREFSKGWVLYLTPHARVLSTFGGHYDLAAYLVIILSLLWALFFSLERKGIRIIIGFLLALSFWLLILTASRISFLAYLVSLSGVIYLLGKKLKKKTKWMVSRWLGAIGLSILIMFSFGDLSERFVSLLKLNKVKEFALSTFRKPPEGFLGEDMQTVVHKSDSPPAPLQRPADVYVDVPAMIEVKLASPGGEATLVAVPRNYSEAALKYDLSTAIRLDVLWPKAIKGFLLNPLLGSGYSTLLKDRVDLLTEAESTDNDYLRMLGETGLLGTVSFLAIILSVILLAWKALPKINDRFILGITVGFLAATIGMLFNATYIDVFEASKVAFVFWGTVGILLASQKLPARDVTQRVTDGKVKSFKWKK